MSSLPESVSRYLAAEASQWIYNHTSHPHTPLSSQYICELALLDHRFFRLAPSRLVCAAILLSNELAGRVQSWPAVLQEHAGHSWEQLRPFVGELRLLLAEAPLLKFEAIRRKYQSAAHRHVASGWPKQ